MQKFICRPRDREYQGSDVVKNKISLTSLNEEISQENDPINSPMGEFLKPEITK